MIITDVEVRGRVTVPDNVMEQVAIKKFRDEFVDTDLGKLLQSQGFELTEEYSGDVGFSLESDISETEFDITLMFSIPDKDYPGNI